MQKMKKRCIPCRSTHTHTHTHTHTGNLVNNRINKASKIAYKK